VVDGKTYLRTSFTGAKYRVTDAGSLPLDPTSLRGVIHSLGALLAPTRGDAGQGGLTPRAGRRTCYSVTVDLTSAQLAALGRRPARLASRSTSPAPSVALTVLVEQDLPNHLAGLNGVITQGRRDGA